MRWKKDPLENREFDKRIIEKFLWFPKCLNGEWRWLEKALINQEVLKVDVGGTMEWGKYKHKWIDRKWGI